jgi:hypothetical protein
MYTKLHVPLPLEAFWVKPPPRQIMSCSSADIYHFIFFCLNQVNNNALPELRLSLFDAHCLRGARQNECGSRAKTTQTVQTSQLYRSKKSKSFS